MTATGAAVEEVQGLFGPFQFPELLLQRLWAEREFDASGLTTADGRALRLRRPGRWNRQGGPDFRHAEFELEGERVAGDIELHLREGDWAAHGHARDAAYDEVRLHVVLFPTVRRHTAGCRGRRIPILVLLPQLWHDLEEYAADAAVAAIAQRPADRLAESWLRLTAEEVRERIVAEARARWAGKVRYARLRVERLGWTNACHHAALEILGYRFNRAPMLSVATAWPLAAWCAGEADPDQIWAEDPTRWRLGAVRPANHPRRRLQAYGQWVQAGGCWPETLRRRAAGWWGWPDGFDVTAQVAAMRRALRLKQTWEEVLRALGVDGAVRQPRADNVWGDGILPLAAAAELVPEETLFWWWYAAWPGDQAAGVARAARLAGIADGKRNPLAWGHVQGLLHQQWAMATTAGRGA